MDEWGVQLHQLSQGVPTQQCSSEPDTGHSPRAPVLHLHLRQPDRQNGAGREQRHGADSAQTVCAESWTCCCLQGEMTDME